VEHRVHRAVEAVDLVVKKKPSKKIGDNFLFQPINEACRPGDNDLRVVLFAHGAKSSTSVQLTDKGFFSNTHFWRLRMLT